MTVQRWEQEPLTVPGRDVVDGWAGQVAATAALAARIAGTDFVGRGFRGSDAAVTACILFGREIGVGPMTALQGIYVVNGSVAMRAQLMRALVLRRGHTLVVKDWTNASCTVVGRRVDGTEDVEVTWTVEDARRARLLGNPAWTNYPRAMLLARATAELCRALFPDVIGGMTMAVEEAEDIPASEKPGPAAPTRTVRRKTPPPDPGSSATAPDPGTAPETPRPPAPSWAGESPPLPPDRDDETPPGQAPESTQTPEPAAPAPPADHDRDDPLSARQRTNLFRLFGEAGRMDPRAERIRTISALVGRRVESFNELTRAEANRAIDTMTMAAQSNDPEALSAIIDAGWEGIAEKEHPALWDPEDDEGTNE